MFGLSSRAYTNNVFLNVSLVSATSVIVPYILKINMVDDFWGFITVSVVCVISTTIAVYFVGCNKSERRFVNEKILHVVNKYFKR